MHRIKVAILSVLLLSQFSSAAENEFFAMDNAIRDVKKISDKAALLSELGYDGITWRPGRTAEALKAMTARDVKIHALMMNLSVSKKEKASALPLKDIEALKDSGAILWVQMKRSGGNDTDAVRELKRLNAVAKPLGLRIAIYPHLNCHVETLEDALRVVTLAADDNIGASLTLCHQLKMQGVQDLKPLLKKALSKLFIVQICGAEAGKTKDMGWDKLIQPLGQGGYDVKGLLRILRDLDYKGPIGIIGFGIRQPAKQHLKQSISWWNKITFQPGDRTLLKAGKDWGPFVGPWIRHKQNPIIKLEDKETYSIQNGPQSVIRRKGKWYMFLMTSQPMVTKLAISNDGLTWTRPHHNYLLKPTMGWEGSYNLAKAAVVRDDEVWLYYFGKKHKTEMIALARSKDLISWQKETRPIFTHKNSRIEGERVFPDCVIKDGGVWYMYYDVGFDYHHKTPDGYTIGVATSKDGVNWADSPKSPVLTRSKRTADSWEDGMVSQCSVTKIGKWFYMLYSGSTNNHGRKYAGKNRMAFGLARARHPEGPWEKYPHNPVFKPTGNVKDFDGVFLQHPCPVKVGNQWRLYYNGWTTVPKSKRRPVGAEYAIGLAFTKAE